MRQREADFTVNAQLKIKNSLLTLIFKQMTPNLQESVCTLKYLPTKFERD